MMRNLHCWGLAAIGALACLGFGLNHAAVGGAAPPAQIAYQNEKAMIEAQFFAEAVTRARATAEELEVNPAQIDVSLQIEGEEREAAAVAAELLSFVDQASNVREKDADRINSSIDDYGFATVARWKGLVESVVPDERGNWLVTVAFTPIIVATRTTHADWKVIEKWEIGPDLKLKLKEAKSIPGFIYGG